MLTRNFKNLLAMVLESTSVVSASLPIKDVTGRVGYTTGQFIFPGTVTEAVTMNETAVGISIGAGDTEETENDYTLAEPITTGVTLTLTGKKAGHESDGSPYVEYYVTATNTSDDEIIIKEICYKQKIKCVQKLNWYSGYDAVVMLDRTVLSEPMAIQAGDAGVIIYKLKTLLENKVVHGVKIVDFSYGTDSEIADMIDAARLGTIDLQTDGGWRVGDQRLIHIDAWTGGNNTAHPENDLLIVISSFEDYNNCGCLMQFDFMECCTKGQRMHYNGSDRYNSAEMYTTTLPALVEVLPAWLKTRLKTFDVLSGTSEANVVTVPNNKLAIRSQFEITGSGPSVEGPLVEYYKLSAYRSKTYPTGENQSFGGAAEWWTRSVTNACVYIGTDARVKTWNGEQGNGVAPFGCL